MESNLTIAANRLKREKLDALVVTNSTNIFYLSGFFGISKTEREAMLIVAPKKSTLITARLYQNEAKKLVSSGLEIKIASERNEIAKFLTEILSRKNRIGFEEDDLKYSEYKSIKKLTPKSKFVPQKDFVEDLRAIKSASEIAKIEKAQIISEKALKTLIPTIRIGQTELEIAKNLEKIILETYSAELAFETIVASGTNSALPHYKTGPRKIKIGDTLLFDFGAKYKGYCADISRTVFIGSASDKQRNIYKHVQNAQNLAISKISHLQKADEPYHIVNNLFMSHKLHDYFTHGLGHGIGLEVHEKPHLRANVDHNLEENMIFSIEPGLYMPWGGVRIEDLVVIKNNKAEVLGKKAEFTEIKV